MSALQTQIILVLLADSDVYDLIGAKIYPMRLPQGIATPAIAYQKIGINPTKSLDGDSGLDETRIQITCWASSYADAVTLAAAIRSALTGSPSLKCTINLELDTQDPETLSFGVILDFNIWSAFSPGVGTPLPPLPTSEFELVEFEGDDITTEIDLPSAIPQNGFYLVILNGMIAQEGASKTFTLNFARNKIIFNSPLKGGDYKDEGIIWYQKS